jgi:hypothetical protein
MRGNVGGVRPRRAPGGRTGRSLYGRRTCPRRLRAAVGVAAVAVLSIPLFGETLTRIQVGGLVLVVAGVVALEAGASH